MMKFDGSRTTDDDRLARLLSAWRRADARSRQTFLELVKAGKADDRLAPGPTAELRGDAPADLRALAQTMTLTAIAERVGVSYQTVRRWAHRDTSPSSEHLATLARLRADRDAAEG
jgi:hypothetical protein